MSSNDQRPTPGHGGEAAGGPQPAGEAPSIYSLEGSAGVSVPPSPPAPPAGVPDPPVPAAGPAPGPGSLPGSGQIRAAVVHGALTYLVVLLASVLALVLAVIGAVVSASSVADQISDGISNQVGLDPSEGGLAQVLAIPFQLAGLAFLGTLRIALTGNFLEAGFEVGARLWAPPLILTACGVAAAWWLGRRSERRFPSASALHPWLLAAVSGVVTACLALLLSAAVAVRVLEDGTGLTVTTASVSLFFGAFVLSALGAGAGRRSARTGPRRASSAITTSISAAARVAVWHYLLFTVPVAVVMVIAVGIAAESDAGPVIVGAAPLWIGTAASYAYGAAFLVPIAASGAGQQEAAGLFDLPGWLAITVFLLFLLVTVVAGLLSGNRSRRGVPTVASWLVVPVVFAALGTVLTLLTTVSATVVGVPFLQQARVGLAPWAFLLFLVWGAVVELVARFVAPLLLPLLPRGIRRLVGRLVPAAPEEPAVDPVDGTSSAPGAPTPLSPTARRRVIVGSVVAGAVVLVGVAAVITIGTLKSTVYNPDREVSAYLDALRDGKAGAAAEILEPSMDEPFRVLMTDDIFGAAEDRITGYEITDVRTAGDTAVVTADIEQGGVTSSLQFPVRKDGRKDIFFDDWTLEAPYTDWALDLSLPEGAGTITVNGVEVDLPEEEQDSGYPAGEAAYRLPVLPGSYEIVPGDDAKYLTLGGGQTADVSVEGYDSPRIAFEATPKPALQEEAEKQIMAKLKECIASTDPEPAGCPNSAYVFGDGDDLRGGSWTLDEEPEFELSGGYDGEYSISSLNGSATYSYEYNSASGNAAPRWKKDTVEVGLYLRAGVAVTGDTMTVETDWN